MSSMSRKLELYSFTLKVFFVFLPLTYLHREAWRQTQGDEVTQFSKVSIRNSHEINNGRHLLS